MPTITLPDVSITLVAITCCTCGIAFGMPDTLQQRRREDHEYFHCPNGHPQHYSGKNEAELLRDQLAQQKHVAEQAQASAKQEREWRLEANRSTERVERRLRATKAVVTRTKRKLVAGRCPCCSHQFKDLKSHMTTRHPNYDPDKAVTAIEAKSS